VSEETHLTLPWDVLVSDNRRTINRRVLSTRYRDAKEVASMLVMGQVPGERPRYPTGSLVCRLDFFPPDNRRRDVTNYLKMLMDCMTGIVYADDYQVRETLVRRHAPPTVAQPSVSIMVGTWDVRVAA
jgi:Holliday junction resolvase RusA-like endonuclease